jgi:hypothetical protein
MLVLAFCVTYEDPLAKVLGCSNSSADVIGGGGGSVPPDPPPPHAPSTNDIKIKMPAVLVFVDMRLTPPFFTKQIMIQL